ncbi:MAG: hypothetical protein HY706_21605 [Candidatus Hydrogenedentes bacterium]|nr:hypothetical protein [Candidatus Hydrogenedentota bacterium]
MARRRNPIVRRLLRMLVFLFMGVASYLSLPAKRRVGRLLGRAAYYLIPRVRTVGRANLDLAYGNQLSEQEKARILKRAAENLGIVAAEFTAIPEMTQECVSQQVRLEDAELWDTSKGVLVIGAHLGNWEWMGSTLQAYGCRTAAITRPFDDPVLDAYVERIRRSPGVITVSKHGAGNEMLRLLREGYVVGVLIDQSPRDNAVPVRFFGQPCWGTIAPVMAAVRARVPIHAVRMVRQPDGRYLLHFSPPIETVRTDDLRKDLVENSQRCQDVIEAFVRENPDQWLWFHRRWKLRPRLEQEWRRRKTRGPKH